MALSESARIVDFDADGALSAGRDVAGEGLLTAVEFTPERFHSLYVADRVLAMYENREHLESHFDRVRTHADVDREERTLYRRELSSAGRLRYFATRMTNATLLRLYDLDDDSGLWVTLTADIPVTACADAMWEAAIGDPPTGPAPYQTPKQAKAAVSGQSSLVGFDADAALDASRDAADGELLAGVEYSYRDSNPLFVSESFAACHRDRAHMDDRLDALLSYCYIDFSERELFERLFPPAGDVEWFLARLDYGVVARIITESQGLLVLLSADAPVDDVLAATAAVIHDTDEVTDSPYHT